MQVEARLRQLEGRQLAAEAAKPRGLPNPEKYDAGRQSGNAAIVSTPQAYNADADVAMNGTDKKEKKKKDKEEKKKRKAEDTTDGEKSEKKKKKKKDKA